MERSSFRADHKKIKLEDFTTRLQKKIKSFRDAFVNTFEGFGGKLCSTTQSDEDKEVIMFRIIDSKYISMGLEFYYLFVCFSL